jgi:acetyltransferase
MRHLIRYAKSQGLSLLEGTVLKENVTMIQMCRELGFAVETDPEDPALYAVALNLKSPAVDGLLGDAS